MNKQARISVRNLVEFIYRYGDLTNEHISHGRALEGTKIHQKVQKQLDKEYEDIENAKFEKEVPIKETFKVKDFELTLEGRIDGIIISQEITNILEIKSTKRQLFDITNENLLHSAQAKLYGYMYVFANTLKDINITVMYVNTESYDIKEFTTKYSFNDLEEFFYETVNKYYQWLLLNHNWITKRNNSIDSLQFPFNEYRPNQRELAVTVYKTIKQKKNLYLEAPTGIGKTISTIFPSIKILGEDLGNKIFYLTAKGSTKLIGEKTINLLKEKGLKLKTLTITAKEKVCFKDNCICNSDFCEYAKGHFDRVNDCIFEIINNETYINKEIITKYSNEYKVCPFETSLDLISYCDFIICDYNYVFDMQVSLKTYFNESKNNNIFLVDEAHNLVDRAREMYSATIDKDEILEFKKVFKNLDSTIYKSLDKINKFMIEIRKYSEEDNYYILEEKPNDLINHIRVLINSCEFYLSNNKNSYRDELLDLYFKLLAFYRISEVFDANYICYGEKLGNNLIIKLFCINPCNLIKDVTRKSISTIFFSATFSPMNYYKEMLGSSEGDYNLTLPSPFNLENREIIVADKISTKYQYRKYSYDSIVEYIYSLISSKSGNYIIFFPSYSYMEEIYSRFIKKYTCFNIKLQNYGMTEMDRESFLRSFDENDVIGFCVLGGVFSEGIDLKGDKLIGTAIIGVGLPQICLERDLINKHFNNKNKNGFHYAYTFPGMNKVIQAVGRVIRTDDDRGIILLIDDRFNTPLYKNLFPKYWFPYKSVKNQNEIKEISHSFFKNSNISKN